MIILYKKDVRDFISWSKLILLANLLLAISFIAIAQGGIKQIAECLIITAGSFALINFILMFIWIGVSNPIEGALDRDDKRYE